MSVDTEAVLVPGCMLHDVADVIGMALGCTHNFWQLSGGSGGMALRVHGVRTESIEVVPEGARIIIDSPRHGTLSVMYHFEWSRGETPGCTALMPPSRALWIATMLRLVEFFGGTVEFQGYDGIPNRVFPRNHRSAEDGQPWQELQYAIAAVEPLTDDEIAEAEQWAAYPTTKETG